MKKILLAYESSRRELDYLIILKNVLELKGYRCELASVYYDLVNKLHKFSPDILVVPWTRSDSVYFKVAREVNRNMIIVDTHAEQLLNDRQAESVLAKHSKSVADYHFVWSSCFMNKWLNDIRENVYIVGNMRMDMYKSQFERLFKKDLKKVYGLDGREIVLFISSFGGVFYPKKTITLHEKTFKNVRNEINETKKQLERLSGIVNEFFRKDRSSDIVIVIRPHPTESVKELKKYFRENKNVKVIDSGGIHEWILNSDVIFTCTSTAILDSYIMGKPCWMVDTEEANHYTVLHMQFAKKIKNQEEFRQALDISLKGEYLPSNYWHTDALDKFISENIGILDGRSFERFSEAIDKICIRGKVLNNVLISEVSRKDIYLARIKERVKTALAYTHMLGLTSRWGTLQEEYLSKSKVKRKEVFLREAISNGAN